MMGNSEGVSTPANEAKNVIPFNNLLGKMLAGNNSDNGIKFVSGETGMPETLQEIAGKDKVIRPEPGYFNSELGLEVVPIENTIKDPDDQIGRVVNPKPDPQFGEVLTAPKPVDESLDRDINALYGKNAPKYTKALDQRLKAYFKAKGIPFTKTTPLHIKLKRYDESKGLEDDLKKLDELSGREIVTNITDMSGNKLNANSDEPYDQYDPDYIPPQRTETKSFLMQQKVIAEQVDKLKNNPTAKSLYGIVQKGQDAWDTYQQFRRAGGAGKIIMLAKPLVNGIKNLVSDSNQPQPQAA